MKTSVPVCAALLCAVAYGQPANLDELLAQAAKWQYETSRKPLQALAELVAKAQASPAGTRAIEQKFIAFLNSDATPGGKDFISKQLSVMGSEASVPALAAMLADPKSADLARYALERIPGPAVDRALREALAIAPDKARLGIVNTLGIRRDPIRSSSCGGRHWARNRQRHRRRSSPSPESPTPRPSPHSPKSTARPPVPCALTPRRPGYRRPTVSPSAATQPRPYPSLKPSTPPKIPPPCRPRRCAASLWRAARRQFPC